MRLHRFFLATMRIVCLVVVLPTKFNNKTFDPLVAAAAVAKSYSTYTYTYNYAIHGTHFDTKPPTLWNFKSPTTIPSQMDSYSWV
jgi:hypothetical protein